MTKEIENHNEEKKFKKRVLNKHTKIANLFKSNQALILTDVNPLGQNSRTSK